MVKTSTKVTVGSLILLLVATGIIISFDNSPMRINVQEDMTLYEFDGADGWTVAASEWLKLKRGSKNLVPTSVEISDPIIDGNLVQIKKTLSYDNDCSLTSTLHFDDDTSDIENFPTQEILEVINCDGLILQIEVKDLEYDGSSRVAVSPESFGHAMKVEWEEGAYLEKVSQLKNLDKLLIRYRVVGDYFVKSIKIFDPPVVQRKVDYQDLMDCRKVEVDDIENVFYYSNNSFNVSGSSPECKGKGLFDVIDENQTTKSWCEVTIVSQRFEPVSSGNISTILQCFETGKVAIRGKEIVRPLDYCKVWDGFVECDPCKDTHGGGADGDCSGSCDPGEDDCKRFEI